MQKITEHNNKQTYVLQKPHTIRDTILPSIQPRIRRLLVVRDIVDEEEAETFLQPDWERDTHDPFLMKDMERAVHRIEKALLQNETIALWSDYDMDGIPGAVVLHDYLRAIGHNRIVHYTPHRNIEGFGLNTEGLETLSKEGASLVITIDCGSTDVEQVAYAQKKGIDVIIIDHHLAPETLPEAYAILNPKQETCTYPEKMLCGAGVVFKLVQALITHTQKHETLPVLKTGWEKWLLDMVGMATIADMVPLRGENRTFAYFGQVVLRKSRRAGLQALLKKARANQQYLTEDDIAFTIAPRINAASRMGHAKDAFSLLIATDVKEAGILAESLEKVNKERKTVVATMKREINRILKKRQQDKPVIVLGNPEWKPSLLGLVAGSLSDEYQKPVFLWGREKGTVIKGSCRSQNAPSVYDLLSHVEDQLITYGGHACSGGFSLEDKQVHTLEGALIDAYQKLEVAETTEARAYDDVLTLDEVTWSTYRAVSQLAPFGEGNKKPLFKIVQACIDSVRTFGKGSEHLEVCFENSQGDTVKGIAFFTDLSTFTVVPEVGQPVSLIAHLEASYFMGRHELRLRLIDVIK
jgi:single-stranded-DNA-specific exonuclease